MIFSEHGGGSGSVGVGGRFEVDTQSRDSGHSSGGLSYETGGGNQVWTLSKFFSVSFCKKSLICLEDKTMTPHRGNTILFRSSQQLPRLRLGPSKGFLS